VSGVETAVHASRFDPLDDAVSERWTTFFNDPGRSLFPTLVGLVCEEVRVDYARMRLPYRPELDQPAGVVHGGAIATLVDTVVVPAIAQGYDEVPAMFTVHLGLNFISPVVAADAVAEGWVVRRGYRTLFLAVEVRDASTGTLCVTGDLVYQVKRPKGSA